MAAASWMVLASACGKATIASGPVVVTITPESVTLAPGGTLTFTAQVTGTSEGQSTQVRWSLQESNGGAVDNGGRYTAPAAVGTYHVIATAVADAGATATAAVTVTTGPGVTVAVSPHDPAVFTNASQAFTATVTGAADTSVTWTVVEASGGTIDSSGNYTAPATAGGFHVKATSVADNTRSDTASVTVTAPVISVAITPKTPATTTGKTVSFSATVSGTTGGQSTAVTWSVQEGAAGGTVNSSGLYTAPASAGTYHVVATSAADTGKTDVATVTVTNIVVAVSPSPAATITNGTITFTPTVTGTVSNSGVTWSVQEGASGGSVTAGGVYTAPAGAGTYHVVATSVEDTSKKATVTVTVTAVAVAVSPSAPSTSTGGTVNFTATVTGNAGLSSAVTWSVQEGASGGSVTSGGVYTAPGSAGTYHVIATSVADPARSDTATVTVSANVISVAVTPATPATTTGKTVSFSATVSGTTGGQSTAVTWSVTEGASGGTVNSSGLYTAPANAGTYHVKATSVADTSKSDTATVTVTRIVVSVTPSPAATITNGGITFTATVTGTISNSNVTWSVQEGASGGSVTSGGAYTAPASAGTYHVVATSVEDTSKKATVTVTVTAVAVAVSPATPTTVTGGTVNFTASVTGNAGLSSAVTWSVVEGAGGSVTTGGVYTAPGTPGTYHVKATSVADTSKNDTATVTVNTPSITVSISPTSVVVLPSGSFTFTATVSGASGGQSTAVTWSVQEGGSGGTITSGGVYTAPATQAAYHVVATSVADTNKSATATVTVSGVAILPADRGTTWNPGMMALGGIPNRSTVCTTISPATCGNNGAAEASGCIQSAIDACAAGKVVQLAAGTFTINSGNYLLIDHGITLRGAGPGLTTLQKTDGAKPYTEATGANPSPIIIIGPDRYGPANSDNDGVALTGASTNLTADGAKGSFTVSVASTSGYTAGQFVLVDERSGAGWQTDKAPTRGQVWASPDFRVVWQLHNPSQITDDPLTPPAQFSNQDAFSWFSRTDRPTNEIKQIASVDGTAKTITFNTPLHIDYRTSHTAQVSKFGYSFTTNAGVESLTVIGGDNGNIRFNWCGGCWARQVENTVWHDEGFAIDSSFRVELRQIYVHDAAWAQPGGAGYAISLSAGTSEVLVEDSISIKANKVMVARSAGTASVFGYNYVDDGYINTNGSWIEVGLNASHMVGPHHVLFEGNYGFNWDSDKTHGNSIYHTVFRNHLSGFRRPFSYTDQGTQTTVNINDATQKATNGPFRCGGVTFYSYFHSFVGNVLGVSGQMSGFSYEINGIDGNAIWKLGWDDWDPYPVDATATATTLRHGNWDYVTNSVHWDASISSQALPASLYLTQQPAFFSAGSGYTWPWVDPVGTTKLYTLPAKARFDAGTPFVQP